MAVAVYLTSATGVVVVTVIVTGVGVVPVSVSVDGAAVRASMAAGVMVDAADGDALGVAVISSALAASAELDAVIDGGGAVVVVLNVIAWTAESANGASVGTLATVVNVTGVAVDVA